MLLTSDIVLEAKQKYFRMLYIFPFQGGNDLHFHEIFIFVDYILFQQKQANIGIEKKKTV